MTTGERELTDAQLVNALERAAINYGSGSHCYDAARDMWGKRCVQYREELMRRLQAAIAAPERARRAVPREPTDAMIAAGIRMYYSGRPGEEGCAAEMWTAMWDAAPIATLPDGDTR
jgi:hypothetical protein